MPGALETRTLPQTPPTPCRRTSAGPPSSPPSPLLTSSTRGSRLWTNWRSRSSARAWMRRRPRSSHPSRLHRTRPLSCPWTSLDSALTLSARLTRAPGSQSSSLAIDPDLPVPLYPSTSRRPSTKSTRTVRYTTDALPLYRARRRPPRQPTLTSPRPSSSSAPTAMSSPSTASLGRPGSSTAGGLGSTTRTSSTAGVKPDGWTRTIRWRRLPVRWLPSFLSSAHR